MRDDFPSDCKALTAALARLTAEAQVPEQFLAAARGQLLNGLSNMMRGSRDPDFLAFEQGVQPLLPTGKTGLCGMEYRTDPLSAAGINCVAANILEFDDTHPETLIHPTAPVLGALLPMMADRECSFDQVVAALAIGTEVAVRVGLALGPSHYERGWHITATCGAFGAAAAVARLVGLPATKARHALAIVSAMSTGLVINLSYPAKSLGMMRAARNGLEAALLAEAGFEGAADALEGRGGFLELTSMAPEASKALIGLGETWHGLETAAKPYPTCAVIHPVLDGVLELRQRLGEDVRAVETIEVEGNPLLLVRADRPEPTTPLEGKLSVQHSVAAAWASGQAGIAEFTAEKLQDPRLRVLAGRVSAAADPAMKQGTARVTVRLKGGRLEQIEIKNARGSATRPLTRQELEEKCRTLLLGASPNFPVEELIALCWSASGRDEVLRVLQLVMPASGARS